MGLPLHVILHEPEIPPNTGNVIRLCANTGVALHLIEPLGFSLDDRQLRRAGLDYHALTCLRVHPDLDSCRAAIGNPRMFAFSTKSSTCAFSVSYAPGDALLFGPETRGLPEQVLAGFAPERRLRLPMQATSRSLNVSNAVAVSVYEAWRQLGFVGARIAPTPSHSA
jgi:tRNA (cytidine/uridine-2'-O-)-methyltransferase